MMNADWLAWTGRLRGQVAGAGAGWSDVQRGPTNLCGGVSLAFAPVGVGCVESSERTTIGAQFIDVVCSEDSTLSLPTSLCNSHGPRPPPFSAHGGVVGTDDFDFGCNYSEGVPPYSPGLPRFAATPGRRKTNAVPQWGSVRFRRLRSSIPDKSLALRDRIAFQQCGPARRSEIVGSRSLLLTVP